MNHGGVEFTVAKTAIPGVWQWQFRIGEQVETGRTETKIDLLAIRRVQLRIDRELKAIARNTASTGRERSAMLPSEAARHAVF
ncbi:hypothetical protein [Bradyrhizobium sp. STM 3561]|uniref:hypothetical protein n=1 Tax=Bradyrhizobium sp. STM 3561 TaxID=578923 RepID=UPI00388CF436